MHYSCTVSSYMMHMCIFGWQSMLCECSHVSTHISPWGDSQIISSISSTQLAVGSMRCTLYHRCKIGDYDEKDLSFIGARAVPMTPHTPGHMEGTDEAQGGSDQGLPACTPAKTVLEFDAASESAASESTCTEPGADT